MSVRKLFIIISFLLFSIVQKGQIDSLDIIYNMPLADTTKFLRLANIVLSEEAPFDLKREWSLKLMDLAKKSNNPRLMVNAYFVSGAVYFQSSRYDAAMPYYYKSLAIAEEIGHLQAQSNVYNHLGIIASNQNNSKRAIYYFRKCYDIGVKLKRKRLQFSAANNLAVDYINMDNSALALHFLGISENIAKEINMNDFLPSLMGNKMECYLKIKDYKKAYEQLQKMYEYIKLDSLNDHQQSSNYFTAHYYTSVGEYAKGAKLYEENLKLIPPDDFQEMRRNYNGLHTCYQNLKDYKGAYDALCRFQAYDDSLTNSEKIRLNSEQENKYASMKTEKELEIAKLSNANNALKLKRNKITIILASVIICLTVVGLGFVYKLFNDKRKANTILETQNVEISQQKKEILDSINYSKRIQDGILPSHEELIEKAGEHFVFYQSKDIVSGDFYWATKRSNGKFIIACCDSTGHGVPGAFMSLLGYSLLTKSEEGDNTRTPADILNYVNEELPKVFKNETRGEQIKDGMDVSICEIDRANLNLKVSGANNSIYHITDDTLHVIKAQKHAVSAIVENDGFSFANKDVKLKKGDMVVMFTDGFADQFGGPKGKKFKYKQLEDILLANWQKPLSEQRQILSEAFNNWKGQLEQIDDVCIIGIRI